MKKQQGFTLVEVTIILLVLVILSSIMLPQLGNYNRLARYVKVREDLGALCSQVKKMLDEVWMSAPYKDPSMPGGRTMRVGLLYGPGDVPVAGQALVGADPAGGTLDWADTTAGGQQTVRDDANANNIPFYVESLEGHLQVNQPDSANAAHMYPLSVAGAGVTGIFGWKGPYFDALTSDPWGNRYAVNTFGLHSGGPQPGEGLFSSAVVCYSAGPDGGIDTYINQPNDPALPTGDGQVGWQFGDDDQGVILSAGGPF